jgi:hypothetical protein
MATDMDPEQLKAIVQDAVDATATDYTEDASIDVEDTVRRELAQRGLAVDDDEWVAELAHHIRSGHPVEIGEEPAEEPTEG